MNTFEIAVMRVLVKRHEPLKLSTLVSGFPDDCEDEVLAAVSSLKLGGYIVLSDYQPNGYVSIAKSRRREILQIVDSSIYRHKLPAEPVANEKKITVQAKYQPQIRAVAIASLIFLGLFAIVVPALPATSVDTEFITHHHGFQPHWVSYGVNNNGGDASASNPHVSQMFVALKDCSQKQQS
jgi:hypothetical protein